MIPTAVPSIAMAILKFITLVGVLIYIIFAAVMVRQEHTMANVLEERFEPMLRMLAYIHLVLAVGLFLLGLVIL